MATVVRVALLTGQRRAEIAGIRKDELDLSSARPCLVIARGRAKNRNEHRVPLSPQACWLLRDAIAGSGESPYVFPGPGGKPILPRSVSKAMERTRGKLGIAEITVHDLRRTVGSMMTRFGVPKDVRERVLNHGGKRKGSITESVYSWYDYDAEKRAALELWADALDCIVTGRASEIENYTARLARLKDAGTVWIGAA
jgi:integrase